MSKINIIFDWSGTLCNDETSSWHLTNELFTHFNKQPLSLEEYKKEFTIPVSIFYEKYFQDFDMEEIDSFYFSQYQTTFSDLFEGVKELLKNCHEYCRFFILSTIPTSHLQKMATHHNIKHYFKEIVGDAGNKKEYLPDLINKHKLIKEDTIFIGDTIHDIETGKENNIISGGVSFGYSTKEMLTTSKPDYLFSSIEEVQNWSSKKYNTDTISLPITTVGGAIVNEKKEILLIKTRKWSNLWGTPGGKVEYGETLSDAFAREIKEETNLTITNIKFILLQESIENPDFFKKRHFILVNYIAQTDNNKEIDLNYESQDYTWAKLDKAITLDLNTPTLKLLQHLQNTNSDYLI